MRLCSFSLDADPTSALPGVIEGDVVVRIDAPDLMTFLASGTSGDSLESHALTSVRLRAPIPAPPSIRDFFAFEQHVATARHNRGLDVPSYWYEEPVFYFTNPTAVIASGDPVPYPVGTEMLDYELEVAAVIGADEAIAGFMIMNDWSARDVQRAETSVGLGPAKAKDFSTTLGPWIVTADEFDGTAAEMSATVNGVERSRGELADLYFGWDRIRERAALNTRLRPGEILGSGTVGTGCILEHPGDPWLAVGDRVELTVTGLGSIWNVVAPPVIRTPTE